MSNTPLGEWLARLELLHPTEIDLGLARVAAVANAMELLPLQQRVITVAGTNGKGSTVAVLEAVLEEAGYLCGTCTSPHLLRFNERIRVAGQEVVDTEIVEAFEQIEAARGDISLTYFEFATLAALQVLVQRNVEVIVLEVGLGGRLDAVNIVDADVAVITSIDIDHQEWLGNTRELIAREKAGILRAGKPAVIADSSPPQSLLDAIQEVACKPCYSGQDYHLRESATSWEADLLRPNGQKRHIVDMPQGAILAENICAGLQALLLLGVDFSDQYVSRTLNGLQPRGRRELQAVAGKEYLLDVAHNMASVNKMLEYIDATPCNGKTICLFSMMKDKDYTAVIEACDGYFDAWFTADQPSNSRAAQAVNIAECIYGQGHTMVSVSKNIRQAFRRAQGLMSRGDRMVVFGSFYTVAEVIPLLEKDRRKG